MTTRTCDKCGIEINTNPMANAILPMFSIRSIKSFVIGWQSVDLCPGCEKKLAEWLDNKAVPVKHGRWIRTTKADYTWECSACGYGFCDNRTTYCYDCGAIMDGEENG
jgi:hypothetical protein